MTAEIDPAIPNNKYLYSAPTPSGDYLSQFDDSGNYKPVVSSTDRSSSVVSSNIFSQGSSTTSTRSRSSSGNYSIASGKNMPIYYKHGMGQENGIPQDLQQQQQQYFPLGSMAMAPTLYQPGVNPPQDSHQYLSSTPSNPNILSNSQGNGGYLYGNQINYSSYGLGSSDMFNRFSQIPPHSDYNHSQENFRENNNVLSSQRPAQTSPQAPPSIVQYQPKSHVDNYSPTVLSGASSNYGYGVSGSDGAKLLSMNQHWYPGKDVASAYEPEYSHAPQPPMYGNGGAMAAQLYPPGFPMGDFVPLQTRVWDPRVGESTSCLPYKPLMLIPGESIEKNIMTRLTCRDNSNEYSPIFKADSRFSNSISSHQKTIRIEKLLRTGGSARLYQLPGINNGVGDNTTTASIGGKQTVSGHEILDKCISAIYFAVGSEDDFASYLSPLTDLGIVEAGREPARGIKEQLNMPEGTSLIMYARHKEEIQQTFMKWTSNRPKTENFFRMEDKKGLSFSLEELKEALDIIMSRPPRRINNYVARQLLTDATYGQGQGVTEFSSNQINSLHSLSSKTRQPNRYAPAGSVPYNGQDGSQDVLQSLNYTISRDDIPFFNSKKSNKYDPHYCRRQGIYKEGWCGYCKAGGWYLMKNSGYLYHQNHEHGIFPGGYTFEDPLVIRRKVIRETRWEGLCGICYHWIDLDHTDRKLWGTWYRHYKLCVNEYEEIKKLLRSTSAPIELVEIKYRPA